MIMLLLKCTQNSKNFYAYGTQPHTTVIYFLLLLSVIGQRKTESYKTNLNKII